jgi:hypothetical protein
LNTKLVLHNLTEFLLKYEDFFWSTHLGFPELQSTLFRKWVQFMQDRIIPVSFILVTQTESNNFSSAKTRITSLCFRVVSTHFHQLEAIHQHFMAIKCWLFNLSLLWYPPNLSL